MSADGLTSHQNHTAGTADGRMSGEVLNQIVLPVCQGLSSARDMIPHVTISWALLVPHSSEQGPRAQVAHGRGGCRMWGVLACVHPLLFSSLLNYLFPFCREHRLVTCAYRTRLGPATFPRRRLRRRRPQGNIRARVCCCADPPTLSPTGHQITHGAVLSASLKLHAV